MKRFAVMFLIVCFVIFALMDSIHDLATTNPISFFSEKPARLLLVAAIAISGGLIVFVFYRLPSRWQHRVTLIALASAAIGCTAFLCSLVYTWIQISRIAGTLVFPTSVMAGPLIAVGLLWFLFYRVLKKKAA